MAAEILQAILTENPIEHEPRHDIKSFIYVLAYSVTRRAVLESQLLVESLRKTRQETPFIFLLRIWADKAKLDDIWTSRRGQGPLTIRFRFPSLVTAPMAELLDSLDAWLTQSRLSSEWNPKPLTHAHALSVLDKAIGKMV